MITNRPTKYPEVNKILDLLLTSVSQVLGNQLVGMYLYGSLSSGDFDPQSSDIDFLVVTTSSLPNKGLPLPFVSYGGSSLVAMLVCVGLVVGVARQTRRAAVSAAE